MKTLRRKRNAKLSGFSLVEALMSSIIFVALLMAVYGALGDADSFSGVQGTYAKMQMDARKVLNKMASDLRMTGWVDNADPTQPSYPYVFTNGVATGAYACESHVPPVQHVGASSPAFGPVREIVFKIPEDLDGDGLLTDASTGNIEWSNYDVSYVLETDAAGINILYRRENQVITETLARYVERITFDTIQTDPAVDMNEIVITVYMARPTPKGLWLETNLSTCVTMRNVEEVN